MMICPHYYDIGDSYVVQEAVANQSLLFIRCTRHSLLELGKEQLRHLVYIGNVTKDQLYLPIGKHICPLHRFSPKSLGKQTRQYIYSMADSYRIPLAVRTVSSMCRKYNVSLPVQCLSGV